MRDKNFKKKNLPSAGMILIDPRGRILLVRKNHTYAFIEFIRSPRLDIDFSRTTLAEKKILKSPSLVKQEYFKYYRNAKSLNIAGFMTQYSSIRLKLLSTLDTARSQNDPPWEFPKGTAKNARETLLDVAKREVFEETGICEDEYTILDLPTVVNIYDDSGETFTQFIYVAKLHEVKDLTVRLCDIETIREISGVKFVYENDSVIEENKFSNLGELIRHAYLITNTSSSSSSHSQSSTISSSNKSSS